MEDGNSLLLKLVLLVVLILMNAFFAASEIAIISLNDSKIKKMAEDGNKRAKQIVKLTKEPSKFLATIQVGVTISGLLASAVAAESFSEPLTRFLTSLSPTLAQMQDVVSGVVLFLLTLILSYFTLVFGELVPKRLAMQKAEPLAMKVIGILVVVEKITRLFIAFLTKSTNFFVKLLGGDPNAINDEVTEEEIRMMVDLGEEKGAIECTEKEMIENVFDFNNTDISEVMTPRIDITAISKDTPLKEILGVIEREKFTRFPVYEGDIDNIVGFIHVKDMLSYMTNFENKKFSIDDVLRQVYYVPESKKTDETFRELQKNKMYMAVVIDEYGGTAGIVTMEDLIEEIVGNVFDEYDSEEENEFEIIDETTQLVDGTVSLLDVSKKFDKALPHEEYDTLAGFIMGQLGRVPEEDERPEFEFNGLLFKIEEVEEKRITKVKICETGEEADKNSEEEEDD